MPPELQTASLLSDWPTVLGLVLAIIAHTWVAFRWLVRQFEKRDRELQKAVSAWNREIRSMTAYVDVARTEATAETARLDKDLTRIGERVESVPTLKEFDRLLTSRLDPLFELVRSVSRAQEKRQQ